MAGIDIITKDVIHPFEMVIRKRSSWLDDHNLTNKKRVHL